MKKAIIAAGAAAALWGGLAMAQDDAPADQAQVQTNGEDTNVPTQQTPNPSDQQNGEGDAGTAAGGEQQLLCNCRELPQAEAETDGGTPEGEPTEHALRCTCHPTAPGTGTGGAGVTGAPPAGQTAPQTEQPKDDEHPYDQNLQEGEQGREDLRDQGMGGSGEDTVIVKERGEDQGPDLNGVTVLLGGGVEGYTGALAPRVSVGPTYGASLQIRPTDILGLEFAYSGALHEIKDNVTHGVDVASGPDLLRNGGRAMATIGLLDAAVQPYLLGGVGVNWYSVRGNARAFGFKDDTSGEVPLGLGLRMQRGAFTADLRGLYNIPFSQDFAPGVTTTSTNIQVATLDTQNDGRYQATLALGANF